MDVVGVLTFGVRFVFGSPSHLGRHLHLDGDSIVSANMGYARVSLQGRAWEWRMGAGVGIISGVIGHSLSAMAAYGHLLNEVPMAQWLFVMVGTHGHLLMVVRGACCHSSIVVVGGHGCSSILVVRTCQWC